MAKEEQQEVVAEVVSDEIEVRGRATDVSAMVAGMNNPDGAFTTSLKGESFADRVKVATALSSSEHLTDNLNKPIALKDYIVQVVNLENEETGEVNEAPRVTLIDADGKAYHATSIGVLQALRTFVAVIGEPHTWPAPLDIIAVEERGRGKYKYVTLKTV